MENDCYQVQDFFTGDELSGIGLYNSVNIIKSLNCKH